MKIKVCGLTRLEDARTAAEMGADFLGFVFAPSPRRLDPAAGSKFRGQLPKDVPVVGVFKDQKAREVAETLERFPVDYLQFHGGESLAVCRSFGLPVIKAHSCRVATDLRVLELYRSVAELFLVDLPKENPGEKVLPLEVAAEAAGLGRPVLLAGGFTPENVGAFVERLAPFGVDVARGIESSPGIKDHDLMKGFFDAVQTAIPAAGKGRHG